MTGTTALPRGRVPDGAGLLGWAAVIYLAATAIGVVMRFALVGWSVPVPFDHLLHAHSHALYFGWAGLVILSTAAASTGTLRPAWLAAGVVPIMAAAFLAVGYAPVSIAVSTAMMLIWYAGMWMWWRRSRGAPALEAAAFRAGFAYAVAASLGIWVLAAVQASGNGGSIAADLAVHSFLSNFMWFFVFGTVGLTALHRLLDPGAVRRALRWWVALAWVSFPLGVLGGADVPVLGPLSRVAGIALLYPAWLWASELWKSEPGAAPRAGRMDGWASRAAAVWFASMTVIQAAAAVGGDAVVAAAGRHGVVLYLHVALLGYVTTILMWHVGARTGTTPCAAIAVHQTGVALMIAGLAVAMTPWVVVGLWMAAAGGVVVWVAGATWAAAVWTGIRRARDRRGAPA